MQSKRSQPPPKRVYTVQVFHLHKILKKMQNNIEQEKASICATHFVYAICRAPLGNILTLRQLTTH